MQHKTQEWVCQIQRLSDFASTEPQTAYPAYVFGLQSKWTFFCRTQPGLKPHLARLDDTITNVFVPALLGRPINAEERSILPFHAAMVALAYPIHHSEQPSTIHPGPSPPLSPTGLLNKIWHLVQQYLMFVLPSYEQGYLAITPYVKQLYLSLPLQMVSSSAFWLWPLREELQVG